MAELLERVDLEFTTFMFYSNGDLIIKSRRERADFGLILGLVIFVPMFAILIHIIKEGGEGRPISDLIETILILLLVLGLGAVLILLSIKSIIDKTILIETSSKVVKVRQYFREDQEYSFDEIKGIVCRDPKSFIAIATERDWELSKKGNKDISFQFNDGSFLFLRNVPSQKLAKVIGILKSTTGKELLKE